MGGCLGHENHHNSAETRRLPDIPPGASSSNQRIAFTMPEILTATNNFEQGDNLLGSGGFGSVYKCYLATLGQTVAVKRLHYVNPASLQRIDEFATEVTTLSSIKHYNVVKLHGYCLQESQVVLVYEYMPLRSLDLHLHEVEPDHEALDWNTRMKIAAGIALGLEYIHKIVEPPIIHGDIKSSNILLEKDYRPKLSGFGFSAVPPPGNVSRHVTTLGYRAPEYEMSGQLTDKSDIYSFGVVLLELLTGRKAHDPSKPPNERNLVKLVQMSNDLGGMADLLMEGVFPEQGFNEAMSIAASCVHEDPGNRQDISMIRAYMNLLAHKEFPPPERDDQASRLHYITLTDEIRDLERKAQMREKLIRERKAQMREKLIRERKAPPRPYKSSDILPARRVTLSCCTQQGEVTPALFVPLPKSLDELLETGAKKFGVSATKVLTKDGAEIDDIEVIRDGDHLVLFSYVGDDQTIPSASYVSSQNTSLDILPARTVTLSCAQQGKVTPELLVPLPKSLEELLETGAKIFGVWATKVLTKDGAEIDDIQVIRDGDHLLLVSDSENQDSEIQPTAE